MSSVPVMANSYMLAHGTREAARPRSTVATAWDTKPTPSRTIATLRLMERPAATGASGPVAARSRPPEAGPRSMVAVPAPRRAAVAPTAEGWRAAAVAASVTSAERRARSRANAVNAAA
jgi:hypothetical protein